MSFFEKSLMTLELPAVLELLAAQAVGDSAGNGRRRCAPRGTRRRYAAALRRRPPPKP